MQLYARREASTYDTSNTSRVKHIKMFFFLRNNNHRLLILDSLK